VIRSGHVLSTNGNTYATLEAAQEAEQEFVKDRVFKMLAALFGEHPLEAEWRYVFDAVRVAYNQRGGNWG
jgi:hypothetical protein